MNADTYTPAPWRAAAPIGPGAWAVLSEQVNAHGNFYVATLPEGHPDAPANARLIAAAPEMLAALREALAYLDSQPDAKPGTIAEVAQCTARYVVRSAIAKASPR